MKHTVTHRVAAGALSAILAFGSLPTQALAEASHALSAQGVGTWEHDGGAWHYRLPDDSLGTGWHDVDGTWYLFNDAGDMLTGLQKDGGTTYYLGQSGGMYRSRWICDGGNWYYLLPSGAAATGWKFIDGAWYYFDPASAVMAHDVVVDDSYLRSDGAWDNDAIPNGSYDMAELSTTNVLDPTATSALFTITSDDAHPFAANLNASTVSLGGDLEGAFTVESLKRVDTHTVQLALKGGFGDGARTGGAGIMFDQGSFADPDAIGVLGVSVNHEDAALLEDESFYDEAGGLFTYALSIGSAQALDNVSVSLPSNSAIQAQSVATGEAPNKIVVSIKAPGNTAYEQFLALCAAYADGGLTVSGTNVGDVTIKPSKEDYAELLAYLAPSAYFYVERGAEGKGWKMTDDGAAVVLRLRLESDSGVFNLASAGLDFEAEGLSADDYEFIDDNTVEFVAESLTTQQLHDIMDKLEYDDVAEFLDAYAFLLGSQVAEGIELLGGMSNDWGVGLPDEYNLSLNVYNNVGLGETNVLEDPLADEEGLETQADNTDPRVAEVERARKAMTVVKHVSTAITMAASSLALLATGGPVIAALGLIAGVFGILPDVLSGKGFTADEVFDAMVSLESQLDGIGAQVGGIQTALSALSADVSYQTRVPELKRYVDKANAYRRYIAELQSATKNEKDRDTFNILQDDYKTSRTGKAIKKLYSRIKFLEEEVNEGESAYSIACKLADLITGSGANGSESIIQAYFNVTANKVNWEPETYNLRNLFVAYVGGAFINALAAANTDLKWQLRNATNENDKFFLSQNIKTLAEKAEAVNKLIGQEYDKNDKSKLIWEGELMPQTHDRTDDKVLCTVNGRLYQKATSSGGNPAISAVFLRTSGSQFLGCFGEMLENARYEDRAKPFINTSTLSRSDFETMAARQAFVRTVPTYSGAKSIYDELILVGLLKTDHGYKSGDRDKKWNDLAGMSWDTSYQYEYAVVSDSHQTRQDDMASVFHKRWHGADMYNIKHNYAAGTKEIYYFKTWYQCGYGFKADIEVKTPMVFNAAD